LREFEVRHEQALFVDGAWVEPTEATTIAVVNPATEEVIANVAAGSAKDVDSAVMAARRAFPAYAATKRADRVALLRRILDVYATRKEDIAQALSVEMGAPISFARQRHLPGFVRHFTKMVEVLEVFRFDEMRGTTFITREPIGVCGLITPWNWPLVQIACKIAPALAAGCAMVLKPSEISPLSAIIVAEILEEAGVPAGVFNLVNGSGPEAGAAIAAHPDVDMVSFTGSTRAGILVAEAAAKSVKRVHQELGGKSANILLPDVDLENAVTKGIEACFKNSGQSCNAPTRMLVPAARQREAGEIARRAAESIHIGATSDVGTEMGPVANARQFERVQHYIALGMEEGACLVAGGPGRPEGIERGHYVRPTVFSDVRRHMTIAREEIFGPVLAIMPYDTVDEAVDIANDSVYGLAAYVQSADLDAARKVAARLRTGTVQVNYPAIDPSAPFGGYKQSGNGREYAEFGLAEFLEIKAVLGYAAA
jgi:aldehyde dehydrogenase (NAD+)